MSPKRICLLTTAHLTDNPRLVKEADAFQYFGYDVTVVACHHNPERLESDQAIMRRAAWTVHMVRWDRIENPRLFWLSRIRRVSCRIVVSALRKLGIARNLAWLEVRAFDRVLPEIMREARKVGAALIVVRGPGLLPVAWKIAKDSGAKCGFDAEDFCSGMNRDGESASLEDWLVLDWEREHLGRYDYLTAAAPLIAREYMARYPISFDAVVLNSFDPIDNGGERRAIDEGILSLYWVSQTIGAHRGIEDVVRALALLKGVSVRLFLRGDWQRGYENKVRTLVDDLRIPQETVVSLPRSAFDEFVSSATCFDVGLAVEEPTSRNRELCVTNKILMYLSAGLAVAATATPAQTDLMEQMPAAGFLFPSGDHRKLAEKLGTWAENPMLLREAKLAASRAAQERFNWKHERTKLEDIIKRVLQ